MNRDLKSTLDAAITLVPLNATNTRTATGVDILGYRPAPPDMAVGPRFLRAKYDMHSQPLDWGTSVTGELRRLAIRTTNWNDAPHQNGGGWGVGAGRLGGLSRGSISFAVQTVVAAIATRGLTSHHLEIN